MRLPETVPCLTRGELVVSTGSHGAKWESAWEILEKWDTKIAGDLPLMRCDAILAAVECTRAGERFGYQAE